MKRPAASRRFELLSRRAGGLASRTSLACGRIPRLAGRSASQSMIRGDWHLSNNKNLLVSTLCFVLKQDHC